MTEKLNLKEIIDIFQVLRDQILNFLPIVDEKLTISRNIVIGFKVKNEHVGIEIFDIEKKLLTAMIPTQKIMSDYTMQLMITTRIEIESRDHVNDIHDSYPEIFTMGNNIKVNELLNILLLCLYTGKSIQQIKGRTTSIQENSWMKDTKEVEAILKKINQLRIN